MTCFPPHHCAQSHHPFASTTLISLSNPPPTTSGLKQLQQLAHRPLSSRAGQWGLVIAPGWFDHHEAFHQYRTPLFLHHRGDPLYPSRRFFVEVSQVVMPRKLYATILERLDSPIDRFCTTEECWIELAQTLNHRAIDMVLMGNADRTRLKGLLGLASIHNQIQAANKRLSLILIGSPKLAATITADSALSECFFQQYHLEPSV